MLTVSCSLLMAISLMGSDPFLGTWQLNTGKSSGSVPQAETVAIRNVGTDLEVVVSVSTGAPSAAPFTIAYKVPARGGRGEIEKGPYNGVTMKRMRGNAMEMTYLLDGKPVRSTRAKVSKDLRTMTSTGQGANAAGQPVSWVMVFDRQ